MHMQQTTGANEIWMMSNANHSNDKFSDNLKQKYTKTHTHHHHYDHRHHQVVICMFVNEREAQENKEHTEHGRMDAWMNEWLNGAKERVSEREIEYEWQEYLFSSMECIHIVKKRVAKSNLCVAPTNEQSTRKYKHIMHTEKDRDNTHYIWSTCTHVHIIYHTAIYISAAAATVATAPAAHAIGTRN